MDKPIELTPMPVNAFIDKSLARVHKFYISGEIKAPSEYVPWFETIRNSTEHDVVVLHINSFGGDLFTAIQFMRVMSESKATIVASVEGACMSAATILFLSAKHWEISNHSMFMFHNYSSVNIGKGGEMYDAIVHERSWSDKLLRDVYKDFLTKAEIDAILDNKDIWMSGEEVTKRLKTNIIDPAEKKEELKNKRNTAKTPAKTPTKRAGTTRKRT
jgi:ATP-dependent protease ClpP protease subunit